MTTLILILAVYLIGATICYIFGRHYSKKIDIEYTISDRVGNLRAAFFSWIGVFAMISLLYFDWYKENKNKPAKW